MLRTHRVRRGRPVRAHRGDDGDVDGERLRVELPIAVGVQELDLLGAHGGVGRRHRPARAAREG